MPALLLQAYILCDRPHSRSKTMNDHYKSIWATSLSVQTVTKSHFPFANSIPINNPNTSLAAHVCNLIFYIKKKKHRKITANTEQPSSAISIPNTWASRDGREKNKNTPQSKKNANEHVVIGSRLPWWQSNFRSQVTFLEDK